MNIAFSNIFLTVWNFFRNLLGENHRQKAEMNDLFEIMSAKTMKCPPETDKHSANASCLSVYGGHYIVLADIISNK